MAKIFMQVSWQDLCASSLEEVARHKDRPQDPSVYERTQETNTATPVSCEPAQSKCTWTCHKNNFVRKFTGEMPDASSAASVLREPAQLKCTWTCHKSRFAWKFSGHRFFEPTQSKCTWTFHKSHFVWKFTGTWPDTDGTTSSERPALTVTARTPQCGHIVWGKRERERGKRKIYAKLMCNNALRFRYLQAG